MFKLIIFLLIFSPLAKAEPLRLLTWNAYMLPSPIKSSKQKRRAKLIPDKILEAQLDLDLVVFQEAFSGNFKGKMRKKLGPTFPHQATLPRHGGLLKVMDAGLMIMSKHPIRVLGQTYFKECASHDCYASKGALLVEMTLPSGKKVQIVTTHLQSKQAPKFEAIRKSQLAQIRELMSRHAQPGIPQIAAGDFNIVAGKNEYSDMLETLSSQSIGLSGDLISSKASNRACFSKNKAPKVKYIDHIILNKMGTEARQTEKKILRISADFNDGVDCDLSDHLPVLGSFELGSTTPAAPLPVIPSNQPPEDCAIPGFDNFSDFFSLNQILNK